jgi:hypothetical protein
MKNAPERGRAARATRGQATLGTLALAAAASLASVSGTAGQGQRDGDAPRGSPTLEETRLTMGKWIETQQIISKERKEWQQGKEILQGRLELIRQEVATLEEKIGQAEASVAEVARKRGELESEYQRLDAANSRSIAVVTEKEGGVRRLVESVPEPVRARVQPLLQRIPADPAGATVSAAERFQNVLGILNELNKANNEITVSYEVHSLADGRPAEVKVIYVGLAQAYFVSASGEAGIGRPSDQGWQWEPSKVIAGKVLQALEILQGKHSPAFVPLPVTIR